MAVDSDNLVWIDMEMTGLDPDTDLVLEMATIITDSQLNIIAEGPCLTIRQTEARMNMMDEWNTRASWRVWLDRTRHRIVRNRGDGGS